MRTKFAAIVAVAAAVAAVPAQATEGRMEVRAGGVSILSTEKAFVGAATGYDFDLAEGVFGGVEVSADQTLTDGADVQFGFSARLGTNIGENGRAYAIGGYSIGNYNAPQVGAGYQQNLSDTVYVKAEYRHLFDGFADADIVGVGLGLRFQ